MEIKLQDLMDAINALLRPVLTEVENLRADVEALKRRPEVSTDAVECPDQVGALHRIVMGMEDRLGKVERTVDNISGLLPDMDDYVTLDVLDNALSDYVQEDDLPDMDDYVPRDEMPDMDDYVPKADLSDLIETILENGHFVFRR